MSKKSTNAKLLTKVSTGIAFGDVANIAIRNILTEISKRKNGVFSEQEMYDTMDYFDWKCPYTGKDLKPLIESRSGGYATDHIYPQNREWCGLNVKGNLVVVDKAANDAKSSKDVESFLLNDKKIITDIDESGRTRQQRLDLIKKFQKDCGYDPDAVRKAVSPLLEAWYHEIAVKQQEQIEIAVETLEKNGVDFPKTCTAIGTKSALRKDLPEIVFYPNDEQQFKAELLKEKKARFILFYENGIVKESPWNCEKFNADSGLRGNIQSRPFWRDKAKDGLQRVEVHID